jgi:hypothetical protein
LKKNSLRRIFIVAAAVELTYLLVINAALNVPLTQTLVNRIKPEKFVVYWEQAWSWYPFRVHARGVSANGQTRSQEWEVHAPAASASVALLPLLWRTVSVSDVDARDVVYFQRPRPKPDKDYAAIRQYFPAIRDREMETDVPQLPPKKTGNGWKVSVTDAHASGKHLFWISQIQGELTGELHANVAYQSRGGPFSLSNSRADVVFDSLRINNDLSIINQGSLQGSIGFSPFVPSMNRGVKALAFMSVDANIGAQLENLDFLSFYLNNLFDMNISGAGELAGHMRYTSGHLLPGTDLSIKARELGLTAHPYRVAGAGDVTLDVTAQQPDMANVNIRFSEMQLQHEQDETPHFRGKGLVLAAQGSTNMFPEEGHKVGVNHVVLTLPDVDIPALNIYQRYLPDEMSMVLNGGQGKIKGRAELSPTTATAKLQLTSAAADLSLENYRFITDLEVGLNTSIPSFAAGEIKFENSYIRLDDARLKNRQTVESQPWATELTIDEGSVDLSRTTNDSDIKTRLGQANADFRISGRITNLEWINVLFVNPYDLSVEGAGELQANLRVRSGKPAKGTRLEIQTPALKVRLLDYLVAGNGQVTLTVPKGGQHPEMDLDIDVDKALFKRQGEQDAFIEDVVLKLLARAKRAPGDDRAHVVDLYVQIPAATVTDMSVYNQYLPAGSPLQLLGGQADLNTDIHLQPDSAKGYVKLITRGLRSRLNDQQLAGELLMDIKLSGGKPKNMEFDISGSTLSLQDVEVTGAESSYELSDWSARFNLEKGRTVWKKPVVMEAEAVVKIKDSRPIVTMFSNAKGQRNWLEKMLTVNDIQGRAEMTLENEQLVVPYAFVGSDKVDAGAKGIIDADRTDGIFYARFRKLDAVLKVKDGKYNVDVIGAKKTFSNYTPNKQ